MAKVLVLYYSAYGHIETMAEAVAEGARDAGASVDIKRVPELVPEEIARKSVLQARSESAGRARSRTSRITTRSSSAPARASAACRRRWRTSSTRPAGLWAKGALHGKVGGAFTSTATQHGGQETTLFSIITNLSAFRHGDRGARLRPCRPDDARRDHRRLALWRHHHHRRRRLAPAERKRTCKARAIRAAKSPRRRSSCMDNGGITPIWRAILRKP